MEAREQTRRQRFTSLLALGQTARHTFERFPLAIFSAIVVAFAVHLIIDAFEADRATQALWPVIMTAILGIPFFYALRVLGESRAWSRQLHLGVTLAGLILLVAYYLAMPTPVKGADIVSYLLLLAAVLLATSFLPFLGVAGEENGIWQYNKVMFLRLATAVLYAAVLYVGLALALGACDALLGFDIEGRRYAQLWYWIVLVYSTWFFMAGMPRDIRGLQHVSDYPTALRIFTQYVLIPLVVVYMVILYAYMAKIIIQWDLPKGWVGYPVIGVSLAGMLALLLVHPIRNKPESKWVVPYAKLFYWAFYPLIVLISVAIVTRISDYGITENRYLVVVATAWLLGIALYFSFRRTTDIRIIPISLCIVSALAAFGPWGATAFARRSQLNRLREMLIADEVMIDGRLEGTTKPLPFERKKEISNVVAYVVDFHGADRIRDWYAEPGRLPDELTPQIATEEMGVEYLRPWQRESEGYSVGAPAPNPVAVSEFDYVYRLERQESDTTRISARLDSLTELSLDGTRLRLAVAGDSATALTIDLNPMLIELRAKEERGESYGRDETRIETENEHYRLVTYLTYATGGGEGDSITVERLSATILVRVK
jgi:heme/copper-type cytochrome/quinol oxidase subunit 4